MKKIIILSFILFIFVLLLASCGDDEETSTGEVTSTSEIVTGTEETNSETTSESTPEESTIEETEEYYPIIEHNVSVAQNIDLNSFDKYNTFKNEGTVLSYSSVSDIDISQGITNITAPGVYRLFGTTSKGNIKVEIKRPDKNAPLETVVLILDGINITSSTDIDSVPPIYSKGCNLIIVLPEGSDNIVNDTVTNNQKGAIYVKTGNLTIEGKGILNVKAVFKSAIFNTKTMTINGGILNLNSVYHGLYAEEGLVINTGEINIKSDKTGIKSGDYDKDYLPEDIITGSIEINGGRINIEANTYGIDVYGPLSIHGGGLKVKAMKHTLSSTEGITIDTSNGETVVLLDSSSDGINTDGDLIISGDVSVKIECVQDGIDAKNVTIDTQGTIYIVTDGIFSENSDGNYAYIDGQYVLLDDKIKDDYSAYKFYELTTSSKGIDAEQNLHLTNVNAAIKSTDNALDANNVVITSSHISIDSKQNGIDSDSININDSVVNVLKANKGFNSKIVYCNNVELLIIAVMDSIEAQSVNFITVEGCLFEKVDTDGKEVKGTYSVSNSNIVTLSSTNAPKVPTELGSGLYGIEKPLDNYSSCSFGKYIKVSGQNIEFTLKLPKSYTQRASISIIWNEELKGEYTISVGDYSGGEIHNFICEEGNFTESASEKLYK